MIGIYSREMEKEEIEPIKKHTFLEEICCKGKQRNGMLVKEEILCNIYLNIDGNSLIHRET